MPKFDYRMNPREGLLVGRRLIAEHGIDLDSAKLAFKSMYPQVPHDQIELALTLTVAQLSELRPPFTVDSVAEQMADTSGAFPWNGPVGNGFTLEEYRGRFRDMARDRIFLAKQLGYPADQGQ
ncbi:hypothetical protein AB0E01_22510 [Nocardia vinacea]|uniref:hypothetical protein n=1 Tax=Nocardia vinacea TaxID=96468 RepID=UPI00340493AE